MPVVTSFQKRNQIEIKLTKLQLQSIVNNQTTQLKLDT